MDNKIIKETVLLSPRDLDELVITEYPYLIAANYRRMLEAENWERKTRELVRAFEYSVRAITLGALSQYLIRDLEKFSNSELNRELFKKKLSDVSLGTWVNYLFLTLKVYEGKRDLFFMRELYDLYWDVSQTPPQQRKGIRAPFERLVQIRNDLVHRIEPKDEASWEKLGVEALANLRDVMRSFSFLQNYDLIRITNSQGREYEYDQYTGLEITQHRRGLQSEENIEPGWFYISQQDGNLLGLHPLLIFWSNEGEGLVRQETEQDVAVFDRLLKDTAGYVATVMRDMFEKRDAALIAQLRELIYYNLERVKMAQQRVKLSWGAVRGAAREITKEQMEGVQKKYNEVLYLQREEVFKKFEDFLRSDKGCFVLTGKSGVGKSNFVLSLAGVFAENEKIEVLTYNGARLETLGGLVEKISQDLSKSIQMPGEVSVNLFAELDKNEDMHERQLLLIFDAINENSDPRGVLQRIDQLAGQVRYPWLKILVTSRPEGWRTMKRGLSLVEDRYYREKGSQEISVELEEFAVKLEPFEREELQGVYEKYRKVFGLLTIYADLKPAIRDALRDPLVLRLISEVYKDHAIPDHIQVNEIYKLYIDSLINSGRLYREDIYLLEQELMPLMIRQGIYENTLTAAQIQMAKTGDRRPLWELLHNTDMLGSGQRVNAAYVRLRDAELLDESGVGLDYVINFKYERFYEFFAGRRLYQTAKEITNGVDIYLAAAEHLNAKVFLWGALVQALVLELKDGNISSLNLLAGKTAENRLLRSALVEVLVRFGEGEAKKAKDAILQLVGQLTPAPANFFAELWYLLRPVKDEVQHDRPQKMIAVEAAARLGMTDLLEELAVGNSPWLRNLAAQNIFYMWKRDRQAGMKVLDGLSYRVRGKYGLPDIGAAESMLALTGAILGVEHKDPATLDGLLTMGRRALRRILYLTELDQETTWVTRIRKTLIGVLYNLVTGAILKFVLRIMSGWDKSTWASLQGLEHFFTLPVERKEKVKIMIPFVDYDEPGLENQVNNMIEIFEWGDQIAQVIVEFSLIGNGVKDFDGTLKVVEKIIEFGISCQPPRFWIGHPIYDLGIISAAHLESSNPDLLELADKMIEAIQSNPVDFLKQAQKDRLGLDYNLAICTAIHPAVYYIYTKRPEVTALIQKYLDRAMKEHDEQYLVDYIRDFKALFEMGYYQLTLSAIRPISNYDSTRVHQAIGDLIVRAKNYDPEYVEDILLRGDFPQEIASRALATPADEQIINLLTYQLATIVYDLFVLGPKPLRNELKWLFTKALELSSFEELVSLIIQEMLNIVLGEVVFTVPADAPSRQYAKGSMII